MLLFVVFERRQNFIRLNFLLISSFRLNDPADLLPNKGLIIRVYNRKYGQFYESDPDTPGDAAETFKKAVAMSLGDIFKETPASTSDDRTKFEEVGVKYKNTEFCFLVRKDRNIVFRKGDPFRMRDCIFRYRIRL